MGAVIAHRDSSSLTTGDLVVDDVTYIDWFIINDGPSPVAHRFFTDLYLDGTYVRRWASTGSEAGVPLRVRNWSGLTDVFNLAPGVHTLKLVVDATNLVEETNETDNVFERVFAWGGSAVTPPATTKRPNLVPFPATDRATALAASSYPEAVQSGALSADAGTFITWGVKNVGLASTATVSVHLYFDDIFVDGWTVSGLLANGGTELVAWDELDRTVSIAPGPHTLRLVVDPGNLIGESDETDNLFEAPLTWASGPPPPPGPTPTPQPTPTFAPQPSLPDLTSAVPYGWDAALVAKLYSAEGTDSEGFDGPLTVREPAYLSYALRNASPVATGRDFDVQLFLDGESISLLPFDGGADDSGLWWSDTVWIPAGSVPAGTHTARLVIDPGDAVRETDEVDNVLERVFEWLPGSVPVPTPPITYTEAELESLLEKLPDLLLVAGDLGGADAVEVDWAPAVLDVATAAYYLATGVSLGDERLAIEILPGDEYDARHREHCGWTHVARSGDEYQAAMIGCTETAASSTGLTRDAEGRVLVTVREEQTPAAVLNTLFHELGRARQRFVARRQSVGPESPSLDALQEAEAQVFEALMWRTLEDHLGTRFLLYPALAPMEEHVQHLIDEQIEEATGGEEHALGYVLMWLAALRDPGDLGLEDDLRNDGRLTTGATKEFYDYMLSIAPESAPAWAEDLLSGSEPYLAEFGTIALSRLVEGLCPSDEGHPALREVAFLAP